MVKKSKSFSDHDVICDYDTERYSGAVDSDGVADGDDDDSLVFTDLDKDRNEHDISLHKTHCST